MYNNSLSSSIANMGTYHAASKLLVSSVSTTHWAQNGHFLFQAAAKSTEVSVKNQLQQQERPEIEILLIVANHRSDSTSS